MSSAAPHHCTSPPTPALHKEALHCDCMGCKDEVKEFAAFVSERAAKAERERVLDELILWCKMEAKIYSQYYLTESGYDILATLEQHLESLRESGEE